MHIGSLAAISRFSISRKRPFKSFPSASDTFALKVSKYIDRYRASSTGEFSRNASRSSSGFLPTVRSAIAYGAGKLAQTLKLDVRDDWGKVGHVVIEVLNRLLHYCNRSVNEFVDFEEDKKCEELTGDNVMERLKYSP